MRLFVLAWRNLRLHRVKSLLIGLIMTIGIAVLFVGNAMIDTAIEGMRALFTDGFTGDMMITGPSRQSVTVFGETSSGLETDDVPRIEESRELVGWLSARKGVEAIVCQLSGKAELVLGEDAVGTASLFGVDLDSYREFFPDQVDFLEGGWPTAEVRDWILLSSRDADLISASQGRPLSPGDRIALSSLSEAAGTVIREAQVAGIIRFRHSSPELAGISLCPADTLRDILGFASLRDEPLALDAEQAAFVEAFDPETLFQGDPIGAAAAPPGARARDAPDPLPGRTLEPSWQYILVRLARSADGEDLMKEAKAYLAASGNPARVQDWVAGAGTAASMALAVRLVFDLLISVVGVIIVIITMNALVISIGERVSEIGTMRALGAQKSYVSALIGLETALLALLSSAIGLLLGGAILAIASRAGIPAPGYFFEVLFGGPVLRPRISRGAAAKALAWVIGMSLLASLYPIRLALRIQPSAAMGQE